MHDDFGVAPGPKTMAPAFQLPREGGESVDLPVERDPGAPVLVFSPASARNVFSRTLRCYHARVQRTSNFVRRTMEQRSGGR